MAKKMQIKLLPNGEIRMETHGVQGKKCDDYVELFKKLVNARIVDKQYTKEYYETDTLIQEDNVEEIRRNY